MRDRVMTLEVSGEYDPDEPYPDPPEGVTIRTSSTTMSLEGGDYLTLILEAGSSLTVNFLSSWLYDVFITRRRKAQERSDDAPVDLTINGDVYVVTDEKDIARVVRELQRN